jgi:hypothetical protein
MPELAAPRSLVGSVFERPAGNVRVNPAVFQQSLASEHTGFPAVKHRTADGATKKSAFARSREESKKSAGVSATRVREVPSVVSHRDVASPDDWREQISHQNEDKVAAMTEEEREQERQEIIERFGDGIAEILRKAREARLKKPSLEEGKCIFLLS